MGSEVEVPVQSLVFTLGALVLGCENGEPIPPAPEDSATVQDSGTITDTDVEIVPGNREPWVRDELTAPGPLTFTEVLYHSPTDPSLEWIELHNPLAFDLDISGWSLDGGVAYGFVEGTVVAAGGYVVVAADPTLLTVDALGPYEGQLSNNGERLEVYNNWGRLIDTVRYGEDHPWPVAADGSGLSLAKRDADAASDHAEHWTVSAELGGTPGQPSALDPLAPPVTVTLVPEDATWRYELSGDDPHSDWAAADFDDSAWDAGQATFYGGDEAADEWVTAWATADNYYALYVGHADGSEFRLVGADPDGDWTTVDAHDFEVTPQDHLYLAAWELPGDSNTPQMTIAEVALSDGTVGTDDASWEWVLGPSGDNPGGSPPEPPPSVAALQALLVDATGTWATPGVEASASADPWGWATSGAFEASTQFIWADSFDSDSITNVEDTYALFRSVDPLLGPGGEVALDTVPSLGLFRTGFTFDGDPSAALLSLACELDDGVVVFLNGTEVLRHNVPAGTLDSTTLASATVDGPTDLFEDVSADDLMRGDNVLAVALLQAEPDDPDLVFGCTLTAELQAATAEPPIVLDEVAPASESPWWVELLVTSASAQDSDGLVLVSSAGDEHLLPSGELGSGERLVVDDLGFQPDPGDVLFLYAADRAALLDAVRVGEGARARSSDTGPWLVPTAASPGGPSTFDLSDAVVIHEIQYHRAPLSEADQPFAARSEEWIELYNRGDETVDLGNWQLVDAVAYELPTGTTLAPGAFLVIAGDAATLQAEHPDAAVIGDFDGRLANSSDRVLLLDASGNPADEVRYFDGGRWPGAADGGGSSLELQDPWADNSAAEAWAASDEGARSEWVEVRYRDVASASAVGPDGAWEELVLGLLDAGEVLIDDLSVVLDPDGVTFELLQDGTFDADSDTFRLLGNHRHSEIVSDPDSASNSVLRLVATGRTGHMHNHAETTLRQPLGSQEVEVSFRARWVSGSNQLHARLYFNRVPRTVLLPQPTGSGTPGQPNTTAVDDLGPTFSDFGQDVAVPQAHESVSVSVSVDDPDGVLAVTLWWSVDSGGWQDAPMAEGLPGRWAADIPGQSAGTIVQVYVEAEDELGATATFPSAGADARALLTWDNGQAATHGLHNLRILMTPDDSDWLHDDVNLMSNGFVGATVIYNETEIFYDVGVRAKGSQRGRPQSVRLGYGVRFNDDQAFRGSHGSVLIDRSEGVGYGQREVLQNLVMTRAGSPSGEYNDLVQLMAPRADATGPAELQLDRFSGLVLDAQFESGSSGPLFEYELIYYPLSTDDGTAQGLKLPQPDSVIGTAITDLGDDKESYRWSFLVKNNEREDDFDALIDFCQTFSLSGSAFLDQVDAVIDVDQWLRGFALATVSGATDQYGGAGSQHNAQLYVRPSDQRVLFFPHDLDYFGSSSMAVIGNSDLSRLLDEPAYLRAYYGHLEDILRRAYDPDYLAPWCDQLGELLPGQDFDSHCRFIDDRASWLLWDSSDAVMNRFPPVGFAITTGAGADQTVEATTIQLEGVGWIDVRTLTLEGATSPLDLTWTDETTWQTIVPLEEGTHDVVLIATGHQGQEVGTDSIVVTRSGGG